MFLIIYQSAQFLIPWLTLGNTNLKKKKFTNAWGEKKYLILILILKHMSYFYWPFVFLIPWIVFAYPSSSLYWVFLVFCRTVFIWFTFLWYSPYFHIYIFTQHLIYIICNMTYIICQSTTWQICNLCSMASKIYILMVGIFKIQITGECIEGLNDLCVGKEYTLVIPRVWL